MPDRLNTLIPSRAAAQVAAQQGYDLVIFLSPPSTRETWCSGLVTETMDLTDVS